MTKKQKQAFIRRVKSFLWRAGLFVVIALSGYLANIGNIREVDITQLVTIFVVTLATYVINEGTKAMNS